MTIRDLSSLDFAAVDILLGQLHNYHTEQRPDKHAYRQHPFPREDLDCFLRSGSTVSLAAEENGTVVGVCFVRVQTELSERPCKTAVLEALAVHEDFRRRGIGSALAAEAAARSRALGAEAMELTAWAFNRAATEFYTSLGMVPQRVIYEKKL